MWWVGKRGDGEQLFSGSSGRRTGDKRNFWRPCNMDRSNEKDFSGCIGSGRDGEKVLTWIGREKRFLLR
jgi:hypothetical protein